MKFFDAVISDCSQGGVMKKSIAKELGDSGIGYHQLKRLLDQIAVIIAFVELQTL